MEKYLLLGLMHFIKILGQKLGLTVVVLIHLWWKRVWGKGDSLSPILFIGFIGSYFFFWDFRETYGSDQRYILRILLFIAGKMRTEVEENKTTIHNSVDTENE